MVQAAAALAGGVILGQKQIDGAQVDRDADALAMMPLHQQLRLLKAREISTVELAKAYIVRHARINPKLNAIVQFNPEQTLRRAEQADKRIREQNAGPLEGGCMTIKASFDTIDFVSTNGMVTQRGRIPSKDMTPVALLRKAGIIVMGKTNVPSWCGTFETRNPLYGVTNNPWDLARTPGGSSGGSAAAVAAALCSAELGGDGGGSIRCPSHFSGTFGLKTTTNRAGGGGSGFLSVPAQIEWPRVGYGPIARTVTDLELVLTNMIDPVHGNMDSTLPASPLGKSQHVDLKRLRVRFFTDNGFKEPTPTMKRAVRRAVNALEGEVAGIEEHCPKAIKDGYKLNMRAVGLRYGEGIRFMREHADLYRSRGFDVENEQLELHVLWNQYQELAKAMGDDARRECNGADAYFRNSIDIYKFKRDMRSEMSECEIYISPPWSGPAPQHMKTINHIEGASYTMPWNLTGQPAGVVPAGFEDKLPIGVQVIGRHWQEHEVLAVMKVLEEKLGGWQLPPV